MSAQQTQHGSNTKMLKKQTKIDEVEVDRKTESTISVDSTSKLAVPNTASGGVADRKTNQKISPPKKRTPFLGDLLQTPSMEKNGRLVVYSQDLDDENCSFDFGDLSSVSDPELEDTVRINSISIQ